ncbi:hypothetical protein MKI79_05720 [Acinetobacter sp. A3.8]|uniref:Uncharacterized protein n=1 Tax=Acinetobacter sedimenti TaxID=2919922 RepID=A0A9X1WXM6_9GAMM|nr:hypothetical protein [Acinetobacter sedimenti]MCJ8146398.1 hypothetical protein [Acinetobacter sedimenti]
MDRDLDYIKLLLNDFFNDKLMVEKFELIQKNHVTGWEIWLQIEFAHFLAKHSSSPEWYREESYEYDKRKEKIKLKLRPDFLVRKKGWRINEYMALEFKQNVQPRACLNNMITDLNKYSKIRGSNNDLRSVWTVGVFKTDDIDSTQDHFEKYFSEKDSEFNISDLTISKIANTEYWFALL